MNYILDFLIGAIKGTPWWVYLIFAYLIWVGIEALKPSTMPLYKLFIIPTIFTFWSGYNAFNKSNCFCDVAVWVAALAVGFAIGWLLYKKRHIHSDKQHATITIPGSSFTLILVLLIFATKYFFGYVYATNPEAHNDFLIHSADLLSSGIITGLLIGRVAIIYHKFARAQ